MTVVIAKREERLRGALWGMFVGDALAMPVHWYYDVAALQRDFGTLRDFHAPSEHHPSSIMPLASTGSAGRGRQDGEVVGTVILHGKKHLWGQPGQHYHAGLDRGDNTLNLLCARVLMRSMIAQGTYDAATFLHDYVTFMTTPGSHKDTYAESYHRDFFANYARNTPLDQCAGREGHDTASIGGLVGLPLLIMAAPQDAAQVSRHQDLLPHLRLTHRSKKLERYALALETLLKTLLESPSDEVHSPVYAAAESVSFPLARLTETRAGYQRSDLDVIGGTLSSACYIEHSFPAILYLLDRYAGDFEAAQIANANVGGDNCHRGAVLGALQGAALGFDAIPNRWIKGLADRDELEQEIEAYIDTFG